MWDVAIVGSGPAGCATALALSRLGSFDMCIVDPGQKPAQSVGETLPPDTRTLLRRLDLWGDFEAEGHEPCPGSCSSWGNDTLGYNDFLLNPQGSGWHLDRERFDALLQRRARERATFVGAKLLDGSPCEGGGFRLRLRGGEGGASALTARFVVDATGGRAAFARHVGARPLVLDRLAFVYGFFDASGASSASRMTVLEAAEEGWWYAASLPGQRLAVAFATDPETVARDGLWRDGPWFARALRTRHVAPRLDGCRFLPGSLVVRPATSSLLDPIGGPDWLAAGDAASSYDPLSSMGIHKALADGLDAAEAIAARLRSGGGRTADYEATIMNRFGEYAMNRNYFYELETRWTDAPFWRRRRERNRAGANASTLGPRGGEEALTIFASDELSFAKAGVRFDPGRGLICIVRSSMTQRT